MANYETGSSYDDLTQEALEKWDTYAEKYRNLKPLYIKLEQDVRKKQKVKGFRDMRLDKVKKTDIRLLNEIPFFNLKTRAEAIEYIENLSLSKLRELLETIKNETEGYAYKTLSSRIIDFKRKLNYFDKHKPYGYDPSYPKSSGPRRSTKARGKYVGKKADD